MQVKIIIGTIAFMLTMMIVGFVAINEPARMAEWDLAREARLIENGAASFKENCATCHGVDGDSQECYDASTGESIVCVGLPLKSTDLLCGNPSGRMSAQQWAGAKYDYIYATLYTGRPWAGMPTWSQDNGGPLQNNQLDELSLFILNWENDVCDDFDPNREIVDWPLSVAELPEGDPDNGAALYTSLACQGCHGDPAAPEADHAGVGPWLGEISDRGSTRIDGYTSADYVYESILNPWIFTAPECPNGDCAPQGMPNNFSTRLSLQEMADVMAFLLGSGPYDSSAEVRLIP